MRNVLTPSFRDPICVPIHFGHSLITISSKIQSNPSKKPENRKKKRKKFPNNYQKVHKFPKSLKNTKLNISFDYDIKNSIRTGLKTATWISATGLGPSLQYINKITMSVCLFVCVHFGALRLGRYKSRTKKDFCVRFFLNDR